MNSHPTFEETYPRHEFAELVRLGMVIGSSTLRLLRVLRTSWPSTQGRDVGGRIRPA